MTNLSYLSKVKVGSVSIALISLVATLLQSYTLFTQTTGFAENMQLFLFSLATLCLSSMVYNWAGKLAVDLELANSVVSAVAKGDFEKRIIGMRDGAETQAFYNNINNLIDNSDAFIRESSAAMSAVQQNKYFRIIMEDGLDGSYKLGARTITAAVKEMRAKFSGFSNLTLGFEKTVEVVVRQLGDASQILDKTAKDMDVVATDTSDQASKLSSTSHQTSQNVQTVSSATEELSSSISEISTQIDVSGAKVSQTISEINRTEANMNELNNNVNTIGDVVALINDIASQTNLLALNATIEASRAGDAGKGFAVVANEVKALAAQTSNATTDISNLVGSIKQSTESSMASFKLVTGSVNEIEQITASIVAAIQEQYKATDEIARSISEVSEGSLQVTSNVEQVSVGATSSQKSVAGLISAASGISDQSTTLNEEVDKFLKEVRQVI